MKRSEMVSLTNFNIPKADYITIAQGIASISSNVANLRLLLSDESNQTFKAHLLKELNNTCLSVQEALKGGK